MNFVERFLKRPKFFLARRALLRIRINDVVFFDVDVVVVVNAEKAQRPIDRLESGLAFEKIDPDGKIVGVEDLVAESEKLRTVRARGAHPAGRWKFARFELEEILRRDVEEDVLTNDWRVA